MSHLSRNDDARSQGFRGDVRECSFGVANLGRGPVRFGFAGGYATFNGETDAGLRDEGDASLYRLAVSVQAPLSLAGAEGRVDNVFSFAAGESDLSMRLIDPSRDGQILQSGEADIRSLGAISRFMLTGFNGDDWIVHPHAEIGPNNVRQDQALVGSGQFTALSVEDLDSTRAHIGLGASFRRRLAQSLTLKGAAMGVHYVGDTENIFHSRLAGAPQGTSAFATPGADVRRQAQFSAGASYEYKSGFVLSTHAFGKAGDVNAYGARISLSKQF